MSVLVLGYDLLSRLHGGNREIRKWRRRAEIEATIAAERIDIARLLMDRAIWQLRLAALDRGAGPDDHGLDDCEGDMLGTLTDVFREEVCSFWERTEDQR